MQDKKCLDCVEYKGCKDSHTSWIFFIIGLIATISIRAVTVLMHISPIYAKLSWYIGVGGFLLFFIYKFRVGQARSRAIIGVNLMNKISAREQLTPEDYNLIRTMLCALSSKKERINYLFIFVLSGVALVLAVYIDFIK